MTLMAIPRSRETARLASCERNLSQIGKALAYYDGAVGHLPVVPRPGAGGTAPLPTMLDFFGIANFEDVSEDLKPGSGPGFDLNPHRVSGLLCPSDRNVQGHHFAAPSNYRADAGSDTTGRDGPFAFGRVSSMNTAEAGAGRDFTAAFSERLIGSGRNPPSSANDYRAVVGPVGELCPPSPEDSWKTDAGSSWGSPGWVSTLYNHSMTPNESPSCVAIDGLTARMGASSGHARRVNVLMLGGSVKGFTPTVDPQVWRKFAGLTAEDRVRRDGP